MPKASVSVVHTATARAYQTTTNDVGFFLFPSIQLGQYQISVQASGFEMWKGQLNLISGQTAVVEPVLKVGGTATEVTVAGDITELVTTTSPTVATIVERQRIEQLPLNGRLIQNLLLMTTPGLESGSVPRVYGLRYASEMLQDGAVLENREWQSIPNRPPGLDTVAEFRVETNNSSAKMNRPGTIILNTRSGSNEVHGAAFETARNSGIGVARSRTDYYKKPPQLARNEFGASLGGPVFLPKLYDGRNKTFFFFAYEGYKLRSASTRSTSVPTDAMRNGDFSGLVTAIGQKYTIYDPLTTDANTWMRQPFPNNQIPMARQSPLAKHLYSVTPLPTNADNPLITSNWYGTGFSNTNQHTETTRIDHRFTDRDNVFFRYSHNVAGSENTNDPWDGSPTLLDKSGNAYIDEGQNDSGVANWTHTFSPTFFGETLVTVARDYRGQLPYTHSQEIASTLGLPNPFNGVGFPRIPYTMSSSAGAGMAYDSSINPTMNYAWILNFDQNFTKIHGRHEFLFGVRIRYEKLDTLEDQQQSQGGLFFNSVAPTGLYDPGSGTAYSNVPYTGHTAANTFLGLGTYGARFNRSWFRLRTGERSGYFQDNFKVNSRLTLNLGLRYEYYIPVRERDNTIIGFDMANKAIILPRPLDQLAAMGDVLAPLANAYGNLGVKYTTPQAAGVPSNMFYADKWDFGPRAGFAYRLGSLSHPTVIRGGYSLFAYPESLRLFQGNIANTIPSMGNISNDPNAAEQSPDGLPNYLLRSVPTVVAGLNSQNALGPSNITGIARGSGSMYFMDPNQPTARAHEWSFLVEREIMPNTVLKTGLIGTHGRRMSQYYSFNDSTPGYIWYVTTGQPYPTGPYANVAARPYDQNVYGSIQRYQKSGWSNNTSFQIELEHRYSKGYAFQLFYVMSNAMRVAGDGWRDDTLTAVNQFLPGMVPTDDHARDQLLYYRRDTGIPKHRVNWNFLVDLPFGRGKMFGSNVNRALDAVIGGWQVAGYGQLTSRYFQLPTSYWGPYGNIENYGTKYPIQDCRSGVCYDGYLYWNGYIPANRINSYGANGKPNGVMGVPDNYVPFAQPLHPVPKTPIPGDPMAPYYDSNTVWVPLQNGVLQRTSYSPGLNPMQNQYILGPMLWNMSASMFKTVKLTERVQMRINVDFLNNVFNMPGTPMPGSDGVLNMRSSANSPRVLQLTGRLSW